MTRLGFILLLLLPVFARAQRIAIAAEVGGFGYRQYGSSQLQRYKLTVLKPVDPTGFSIGTNAQISTAGAFFGQAGLRFSNQHIGVQFTDTRPDLPAPDEAVLGVGLALRQIELPVYAGFRVGDRSALHLDVFGGLTPSLNYYGSRDQNVADPYRRAVIESLNRFSLAYAAGMAIRLDRWSLTTTWEQTMTSLNRAIADQNQSFRFNTGYEGVRAMIGYQFNQRRVGK